jgi:hypothetical protein
MRRAIIEEQDGLVIVIICGAWCRQFREEDGRESIVEGLRRDISLRL